MPRSTAVSPQPSSDASPAAPKHVFLVDGSGYVFRAFHALPPMSRSDGTPVGAVLGFTNMLMKLLGETGADHIAVIFDAAHRSFRNDIYTEYKANRTEPPDELRPQFGLVREATRAFNIACLEMDGYEADDLIATYATQAAATGARVTIVSSDKDLMQLVNERIVMLDPIKNRTIGVAEVTEKFGVPPEKVIDVQALAGDSTDNVPGVPGIGIKTAAELITTFGDLDSLLTRAHEIKQPKRRESLVAHADNARISRDLVRLKCDVPVEHPLDAFARREPDPEALLAFLGRNEFKSVITRVQGRLADQGKIITGVGAGWAEQGKTGALFPSAAPAKEAAPATVPVHTVYELVQTVEALQDWVRRAIAAGVVAFDVHSPCPDSRRADLCGISLSVEPGRAAYVPLRHRSGGAQGQLDLGAELMPGQIGGEDARRLLRPLLEDPGVLKVGHNLKSALGVLIRNGIAVSPIDDVQLISYVLKGGAHDHSLGELAERHLERKVIDFGEVAGTGRHQIAFDNLPPEKARDYAAEHADVALRLHRVLKPQLVQESLVTVYETIERPLVRVIAEMECAGIKVDRDELRRLSHDLGERLAEIERQVYALAGRSFNIGSPKQLSEILFDEMGLAGGKKTKTGAYATGVDVLEELAAQGHDLPARVVDWRELSKLKNTYADALLLEIHPDTQRVHTSFQLAATSTGRLSSSEPNLQNIPIRTEEGRKIRRAFIAEPGCKLLSVDYSQIELRLAAHAADIEALKQAFRNGDDIHALTASQVFGVPVAGMDPQVRRRAKAINFGIIYGISPFGLAAQLGISQGEAKTYIDAYFQRYPGIRDYMERMKRFCRETGYVPTLFGRRCYIPGINDRNPARRSNAERAAINAPLQGSAADIIKRAMIRIPPALEEAGLHARMLLQVHDELLFEVPEDEAEASAALIKRVMERAPLPAVDLSVPLVADAGIGDNWAQAH